MLIKHHHHIMLYLKPLPQLHSGQTCHKNLPFLHKPHLHNISTEPFIKQPPYILLKIHSLACLSPYGHLLHHPALPRNRNSYNTSTPHYPHTQQYLLAVHIPSITAHNTHTHRHHTNNQTTIPTHTSSNSHGPYHLLSGPSHTIWTMQHPTHLSTQAFIPSKTQILLTLPNFSMSSKVIDTPLPKHSAMA
jgi:hypothetical protein